jgi:hypothetical protein
MMKSILSIFVLCLAARAELSLVAVALSAQTLQFHAQTGTRPATQQQIADMQLSVNTDDKSKDQTNKVKVTVRSASTQQIKDMQAKLDANVPRGTLRMPVLPPLASFVPAIKIPAPPLRSPVPTKITNPSCRYFPFYQTTTPSVGTIQIDPSTGLPECVAYTWSLGALDGLPNRTIFEGTWEAIFSNDSIQYPNFTVQVVSNCGPSFGEVYVDWDTYYTTYLGTPAFQIAGNVYVDNGFGTSLILVGEYTVFWEVVSSSNGTTTAGWVQEGGSVPAGGITCPAN